MKNTLCSGGSRIIRWNLQQGDTLSYIMEYEENEHWWLAEYNKGQVTHVPVAYLMNILDERQSRKRELIVPLYFSNVYILLRILYAGMKTPSPWPTTCIHLSPVAIVAAVADGGCHCNIHVHDNCNLRMLSISGF